jgi:hypothetical protein
MVLALPRASLPEVVLGKLRGGTNTTSHPPPVTAPRHNTTHPHTAKSHQSGPQKNITSLHSTTTKTHQSELCQNSSIQTQPQHHTATNQNTANTRQFVIS